MGQRLLAFLSLPAVGLFAQDADRKPSQFPDIEEQAQRAASRIAAGSTRRHHTEPAVSTRASRSETSPENGPRIGKACFFSSSQGGRTAGGENADASRYGAAHATIPLGSRVSVTNLANGKTVEVQIFDRLPDARRIISVSEAAARDLGFYATGVANVRVEALREAADREKP
jgi:rare lipoprotein A